MAQTVFDHFCSDDKQSIVIAMSKSGVLNRRPACIIICIINTDNKICINFVARVMLKINIFLLGYNLRSKY